jgi:hypothetical protein
MIIKATLQKILKAILYPKEENKHNHDIQERINLTSMLANEEQGRIKHYKTNKMAETTT